MLLPGNWQQRKIREEDSGSAYIIQRWVKGQTLHWEHFLCVAYMNIICLCLVLTRASDPVTPGCTVRLGRQQWLCSETLAFQIVNQVVWHRKGDYFATVLSDGNSFNLVVSCNHHWTCWSCVRICSCRQCCLHPPTVQEKITGMLAYKWYYLADGDTLLGTEPPGSAHMWYMVVQDSSWNEQLNSSSSLVGLAQAPWWAQLIPEQVCMVYSVWCVQQPLCGEVIPSGCDIFFSWYPCSHIWKQVLLVQWCICYGLLCTCLSRIHLRSWRAWSRRWCSIHWDRSSLWP